MAHVTRTERLNPVATGPASIGAHVASARYACLAARRGESLQAIPVGDEYDRGISTANTTVTHPNDHIVSRGLAAELR